MKSKSSPQSFPEQPSFSDDPILEMLGEELSEDEKNCMNDAAASLAYDVPSLPLNPNRHSIALKRAYQGKAGLPKTPY